MAGVTEESIVFAPTSALEAPVSPVKVRADCACSPKVATPLRSPQVATPLRGRKRTASIASLSQEDVPPKAQLIALWQGEEMDEVQPTAEASSIQHVVGNDVSLSFDTLESYKTETDSTIDLNANLLESNSAPVSDDCGLEIDDWNAVREMIDSLEIEVVEDVEWEDSTTGAMLGYAACDAGLDDEGETEAVGDTDAVDAYGSGVEQSLQVTIEWKDAVSGTKMGYLLCDEDSQDLQAACTLCEDGEEAMQKSDLSSSEESVDSTTDEEAGESVTDDRSMSQASSDYWRASEERESCDSSIESTSPSKHCVRQDSASGAELTYEVCEEDMEDAASQEGVACESDYSCELEVAESIQRTDHLTGTVLAYESCSEGIEQDAIQLGLIELSDDIETQQSSAENGASSDSLCDAAELQQGLMRKDEETGATLVYALCEDDIEEEAFQLGLTYKWSDEDIADVEHQCDVSQDTAECDTNQEYAHDVTVEWKDPDSGVTMCYSFSDEVVSADVDEESAQHSIEVQSPKTLIKEIENCDGILS